MELILIVLTGILMGAFNFGFFLLGAYYQSKKESENGMELTKDNAEFVREMMDWKNYGGK